MAETTINTTESAEMYKFYRVLAMIQANSISYVMGASDAEDMKGRAKEITEKLQSVVKSQLANSSRGNRCGPDEIWNPITQQCEPA